MAARRSWPRPVIRPSAPWRWLPVGRRRCCSSSTLPLAPDSPAPLKLARNRFSDHDRLSISFVLDSLTRTGCLDAGGFLVASGRGQHLWTHFSHGWPTFFFCTNLKLQMAQQVSCCDAFELDVAEFFFGRIVFALAVVYWVERGCRSPSALLMASGRRILHSRFVFTGFSRGVTEFWWLVPPWRAWSFSTRLEPSFFFFVFIFDRILHLDGGFVPCWPDGAEFRRRRRGVWGISKRNQPVFDGGALSGLIAEVFFWLFGVFFFSFYRPRLGLDGGLPGWVRVWFSLWRCWWFPVAGRRKWRRRPPTATRRRRETTANASNVTELLFLPLFSISIFFYAVSSSSSSSASSSSSFFWFFSLFF